MQVGNEAALKEALVTIGPVSVCVDLGVVNGYMIDTFAYYKSGIWDGMSTNKTQCLSKLTHAMVLVGYGTENGVDYWLIRNSWGVGWGEKGHIRVKATGANLCGITNESVVPVIY